MKDTENTYDNQSTHEQVRTVIRVTWLGVGVNLLLAALKFAGGITGGSRAVVADAVHSLTDLVTDAAVIVGARFWSRPPDEDHPHGHQRIETLVALGIALVLALTAFGIARDALVHLGDQTPGTTGLAAFFAAALSIAVKELLYRWTLREGRRCGSQALIANAWHHRSDALSSFPAAAAALAAWFSPDLWFVDGLGAIAVCLFIAKAAWEIAKPALDQLIDRGASRDTCLKITEVGEATEGVREVHAVRTRYIGSKLQADMHVLVDSEITVREGHEIARQVRLRLLKKIPAMGDVTIHIEPAGLSRKKDEPDC